MTTTTGPEADTTRRNVDCAHAVCAGSECLYTPPPVPTLGPHLPITLQDADGGYWTRHNPDGQVYYHQKRDGSGYLITTWSSLHSKFLSTRERNEFPMPYSVHFAGHWSVTP